MRWVGNFLCAMGHWRILYGVAGMCLVVGIQHLGAGRPVLGIGVLALGIVLAWLGDQARAQPLPDTVAPGIPVAVLLQAGDGRHTLH